MLRPFRLKGPIGLEYNMDLDDAFNTKKALRDLGHFRVPKFGLTPYPDEPMIDGIKSFQRQNGLREDGVMKPDGPTIKRLNDTLVERQRPKPPPSPFTTVPWPRPLPLPPRRNLLDTVLGIPQPPVRAPFQSDRAALVSAPGKDVPKPAPTKSDPQLAMARKPRFGEGTGATEGATIPSLLLGGGGAAAIGTGILIRELHRQQQEKKGIGEVPPTPEPGTLRPRTDMAPPLPPTPGLEPPDDRDRPPTKTESPATPVNPPVLGGFPLPERLKKEPLIFEALKEELRNELNKPLESHRGDDTTQRGNGLTIGPLLDDALKAWGPEDKDRLKHTHGADTHPKGHRLKEEYLKNRETGERKGSSNPDLTLLDHETGKKIRINTGRTLKDGETLIAEERRQLQRLLQNSDVGDLVDSMPKLRPGMDEEKWSADVVRRWQKILVPILGPPKKS